MIQMKPIHKSALDLLVSIKGVAVFSDQWTNRLLSFAKLHNPRGSYTLST